MPSTPGTGHMALGRVAVATPATFVPILQNFVDVDTIAEVLTTRLTGRYAAKNITIQADPTNAALAATTASYIYVRKRGIAGADGILYVLAPGQYASFTETFGANLFNLLDYELDSVDATAGAYVSAIQV